MDHYSKFSPKAEIYANYRWDYHPEAIAELCQLANLNQDSIVADIGSGTGMLTAHFVDKVKQIYAVEPNPDMRAIAINNLQQYREFVSVDGLADATTLPDHSVDLIVVGRAIHWFNSETTKTEFSRILKPNGWLAICRVAYDDQELLEAFRSLRQKQYGWNISEDKSKIIENNNLATYYQSNHNHTIIRYSSVVQENWQQFFGRICSHSPAPNSNHPLFKNLEFEAQIIFQRYQKEGLLTIKNVTEVQLSKIEVNDDKN
jgi:ubiquinone/menaquinone biosynthesis C-methylase UbiE